SGLRITGRFRAEISEFPIRRGDQLRIALDVSLEAAIIRVTPSDQSDRSPRLIRSPRRLLIECDSPSEVRPSEARGKGKGPARSPSGSDLHASRTCASVAC